MAFVFVAKGHCTVLYLHSQLFPTIQYRAVHCGYMAHSIAEPVNLRLNGSVFSCDSFGFKLFSIPKGGYAQRGVA